MKTSPSAQTLGFFDLSACGHPQADMQMREPWLEAKGNPSSRLDAVIDWEGFRPLLEKALAEPAKGPGPASASGANDPIKRFKLLPRTAA